MPSTYTLISSNVLTSSAASVTFSAIPSTYTDLVLRISARTDGTSLTADLVYTVNGDSTTKYSSTILTGSGSGGVASYLTSSQTTAQSYYGTNSGTATANTFGSAEVYFPNYLATTSRPMSVFGVTEGNVTNQSMGISAQLYRGTSAISSIAFTPGNGSNFVSGSSFYLYGIKNS